MVTGASDALGGRDAVALVPPGLEPLVVAELAALGIVGRPEPGGVAFKADWASLRAVHLRARLPARVVLRVGRLKAGSLDELAAGVRKLPWRAMIHPRQPVEVEVTTSGGRLHRKDVVGHKVELAIQDALRGPRVEGPRPPKDPVTVLARIEATGVQISIDVSGDPLHKRGWREETAKAPMRENLAAAVLAAVGWTPAEPLVDPMCGAGTLLIEAARIAAGQPATLQRTFAWERFPAAPRAAPWPAPPGRPSAGVHIEGGDRDAGAVRATLGNARRAQVEGWIAVHARPFEAWTAPAPRGLLLSNPPWGQRIGEGRAPWPAWAELLAARWSGWRVAWVVPESLGAHQLGWSGETVLRFESGGVRVRVELGEVP
jgi:putative N6-adenine-specific DNA methylase